MKLFDDFEAVRLSEENLIFITHNGYIYYIYNPEFRCWQKYKNSGNDHITVGNYPDVSRQELTEALNGIFPEKETDFIRHCAAWQLSINNMLNLLEEDYPQYMSVKSDWEIYHSVHRFLLKSDVCHVSFLRLKALFDAAVTSNMDNELILGKIRELCLTILGRDIFKEEIYIVDGPKGMSYFNIMPVRIIDYTNTDYMDSVAKMHGVRISIDDCDVKSYLEPFIIRYFDDWHEANKNRAVYYMDFDGKEHRIPVNGFDWNVTYNFFTQKSMTNLLNDIRDTIDALSSERENEYTIKLRKKRNIAKAELIIDFYRRFIYRMEYMMNVGKEKGYDLILFMGP